MITGTVLLFIFVLSIAFLLITIMKCKMNAFISLLLTSVLTGLLVQMPPAQITGVIAEGFSDTVGGIGIVTGLGVVLGMLLFESGGILVIADTIIKKFGDNQSPTALALSAFVTGIPVFGDIVDILFAPIVRTLSFKTGISRMTFVAAVAVSGSIAASAIVPTPAPLAVGEILDLNVGYFFVYSVIAGVAGMLMGGILWGKFLNQRERIRGNSRKLDKLDEEELKIIQMDTEDKKRIGFGKAVSMILLPIGIIVCCSFLNGLFAESSSVGAWLNFFGDKNIAMLIGVLYGMMIAKPYLKNGETIERVIMKSADQVGLVLLITGAGGSFGAIIQETGIGEYLADTFSNFHIPLLLLCFILAQLIRCAQGSTTVALMTTASIMKSGIAGNGISPILAAIAICAGGVGLSLPNDSGFWSIGRFNRITVSETFEAWTVGGFIAGVSMFGVVCILSVFQNILPGL